MALGEGLSGKRSRLRRLAWPLSGVKPSLPLSYLRRVQLWRCAYTIVLLWGNIRKPAGSDLPLDCSLDLLCHLQELLKLTVQEAARPDCEHWSHKYSHRGRILKGVGVLLRGCFLGLKVATSISNHCADFDDRLNANRTEVIL